MKPHAHKKEKGTRQDEWMEKKKKKPTSALLFINVLVSSLFSA